MAPQWKTFEVPSKFYKFTKEGEELTAWVVEKTEGKFGLEVTLALPSGRTTILSCSSAQLAAWAEHVETGETWRIKYLGQAEGRDGNQGLKKFAFEVQTGKAAKAPVTAPARGEVREPGEDDDLGDDGESPFTRSA